MQLEKAPWVTLTALLSFCFEYHLSIRADDYSPSQTLLNSGSTVQFSTGT